MTVGKEGSSNDAPIIKNNCTLVPLRYVSEQLWANVLWIPNTKKSLFDKQSNRDIIFFYFNILNIMIKFI